MDARAVLGPAPGTKRHPSPSRSAEIDIQKVAPSRSADIDIQKGQATLEMCDHSKNRTAEPLADKHPFTQQRLLNRLSV